MKITRALFAKGTAAFFFDDQRAIKAGLRHDGFDYVGRPQTAGFCRVRAAGESISVLLLLDDGQVAVGDCARDGGLFAGSYAVLGGVAAAVPVDLHIKGCPPTPRQLLEGLLALIEKAAR